MHASSAFAAGLFLFGFAVNAAAVGANDLACDQLSKSGQSFSEHQALGQAPISPRIDPTRPGASEPVESERHTLLRIAEASTSANLSNLAERARFELAVVSLPRRFSRPVP